MRRMMIALALFVTLGWIATSAEPAKSYLMNPNIDMNGYLQYAQAAAKHRDSRRVSEEEFIRMAAEKGTIILDARSKEKYDLLHIKGAINISFPDITIASLRSALPDPNARILIYCNNNFKNNQNAFPSKLPSASLNIATYITLYQYGYRNVYELAPLVDPAESKLPFEPARPTS